MGATLSGGGAFYGAVNPPACFSDALKKALQAGLYFSFAFPQELIKASKAEIHALKHLMQLICIEKWSAVMAGGTHMFYIANQSSVDSLQSSRSHDCFWQKILKEFAVACVSHDLMLHVKHITGYRNRRADHLSPAPSDSKRMQEFLSEAALAGFLSPTWCIIYPEDLVLDPYL
jgi:hypothetical protein